MTKNLPELGLRANEATEVDKYQFEPIKGYPTLNWKGKRPFRSTQYYPAQLKETHGEEIEGWRNKIFWGDNLQVMSHLLKQFRGKIDLVYIDPPFDSKADYKKKIKVKGQTTGADKTAFEEKQYTDIWVNDEYLQFIYERLMLTRELMADEASIYLHCDYRKSHYIKLILDEIFGSDQFVNEIVWVRTNAHNMKSKGYVRSNDHILYFSKQNKFLFNEQYLEYSNAQLSRYKKDSTGKLFKAVDLTFSTINPNRQFEWRGTKPPPNRSWGYSYEKLEELWNNGRILTKRDGCPRMDGLKVYLSEMKGNPLTCNWADVSRVGNTSGERLDYPTQKPEELIERILKVSSNPGDIIFDCFMGSGTTQAVAMKLGRRFIGADINLGAIQTTTKRLIKVANDLSKTNEDMLASAAEQKETYYPGFDVYNVNHYDFFRSEVEAKELIIEALEIQKLEQGNLFDGEKDGRMVKIMPINQIATAKDLNELISGFDYKAFQRRQTDKPNVPVEKILLVCMGHEPDLAARLQQNVVPFRIDVEVVDILRDKANLEFKRDSEAKISIKKGHLVIDQFYPMNLLQKLSQQKENVEDWRELVESVMVDWNYDGAVLQPAIVDLPEKTELVVGRYKIPKDAGTIRVKITDLLSESLEVEVRYG